MSEYKRFERCIICRTRMNLQNYKGDFEVTMLLNSLYLAVMYPIENRQRLHLVKAKIIAQYLRDHNIVCCHNNIFDSDDIVRYLRNSLAHYNVAVEKENEKISKVVLWGINQPDKTICKITCEEPKCRPKQYKADTNGAICSFRFTVKELETFTLFVIDHVLGCISNDVCVECKYRDFFANLEQNK